MNAKTCPTCHAPIPENAPGGLCPACVLRDAGEPPAPGRSAPPLEEIAAAFPQWEILELIGQGGMGFVYKVRQPSLDRIVALKILSPELNRDPAFAERFAREARTLGKLQHPNIVTIFEHGEAGGFFYLLMEYVDGVNLRQAMRAGRFTPEQALAIVPGVCDALQAAHAQGIWHRDIKPENILLDREGKVKIADFGIARLVGDPQRDFTLTMTGHQLGSAAYMAPEQHEKPHTVDHRADIYSLGVVIYEMLTGELPLGRFPIPSQRAEVSARIDEIVLRTLEKERELRQQSATEVKTEVEEAGKAPLAGRPKPPKRAGSKKVLLGCGVVLLLALVAAPVASVMMLFSLRQENLRVDEDAKRKAIASQEAAMKEAKERRQELKARAVRLQRPREVPNQPMPTASIEEAVREMNKAANESNGDVFMKHMDEVTPLLMRGFGLSNPRLVEVMELFSGDVVSLRATFQAIEPNVPLVYATFRRSDGGLDHLVVSFEPRDGQWRLSQVSRAEYRASCRIEFRPEKGDAATILRTHLGPNHRFNPVDDVPGQFDIPGDGFPDAETAVSSANELAASLRKSLDKLGFAESFKIVRPAAKPEKPYMGEDEPLYQPNDSDQH